jgi:hypothetical protein
MLDRLWAIIFQGFGAIAAARAFPRRHPPELVRGIGLGILRDSLTFGSAALSA